MEFSEIKKKFVESEFKSKLSIKSMNELSEEEKKIIVSHAINDADPYKSTELHKLNISNNQNKIIEEILKLFDNKKYYSSATEYNGWYKGVCVSLVEKVPELKNYKFGKLQKIINMTLKYLYCFSTEKTDEAFKYCHMPLDSYIYKDWYLNDVRKSLSKNKKGMPDGWSNIDKDVYYDIQGEIADYIKNMFNGELTPLQAEFYLWPYLKCRRAKNELEKLYKNYLSSISGEFKKELVEIDLNRYL